MSNKSTVGQSPKTNTWTLDNLRSATAPYLEKAISARDEFFWFLMGQLFNLGTNFFIIKAFSNVGKSELGQYVLILTISSLLSMLIYGQVQQGFMRFFYTAKFEGSLEHLMKLHDRFIKYSSGIILFAGLAIAFLLSSNSGHAERNLLLCAALFIVSAKWNEFYNVSFNVIRKRKLNSVMQISEKSLVILLLGLLLWQHRLTLLFGLGAITTSASIFAAIKYVVFRKIVATEYLLPLKESEPGKTFNIKAFLAYCSPFLIWGVSAWLQQNGEKWIIANYLSMEQVGLYGLMITVVNMLIAIPNTLLNDFSAPLIFNNFSDFSDQEKLARGNKYILFNNSAILGVVLCAITITFVGGTFLLKLFGNASYTALSSILPAFTLGTGIFYFAQTLCNKGMAFNKPGVYLIPKLFIGVSSVVLNLIFIRRAGVAGAAYASVVAGIIYLTHIIIINRRLTI